MGIFTLFEYKQVVGANFIFTLNAKKTEASQSKKQVHALVDGNLPAKVENIPAYSRGRNRVQNTSISRAQNVFLLQMVAVVPR